MVNPDTLGICRAVHRVYRMEVGSNISFAKFTEHVLRLYMFKVEQGRALARKALDMDKDKGEGEGK